MRYRATDANSGRRAVRLTVLAICAVFVLALVLSSAYILANANHRHDHSDANGGCVICSHMVLCTRLIERLGTVITIAAATVGIAGVAILLRLTVPQTNAISLIGLKVCLNN